MLNLAIDKLLSKDWRAMALIDVGTEFDSLTWPQDALRLLADDAFDALQLFSNAVHMDAWGNTTRITTGFGYNCAHGFSPTPANSSSGPPAYWYPGLAWAYARQTIEGQSRVPAATFLRRTSRESLTRFRRGACWEQRRVPRTRAPRTFCRNFTCRMCTNQAYRSMSRGGSSPHGWGTFPVWYTRSTPSCLSICRARKTTTHA